MAAEAVDAGDILEETGALSPGTDPVKRLGIVGATSTAPVARGCWRPLFLFG